MAITEISIIHHVGIVLLLLWLLSSYDCCHPFVYFASLIYLYLVNDRYSMRLWRKLQFEERKSANQSRILTDSETVRWLNHAVEKMWPICMEQIISQRIFLPIMPWFLAKYKPWTVKQAAIQNLYLGRSAPLFTDIRVLHESSGDDHLVLELGMNFLTADDMNATLFAKLRKRLGFGIVAKMHLTSMHVEGKVLVGVKFLRNWPYIGRLRVCFAEPPYFQMTVKPIFPHGLDVTELPGVAGWLDNLLAVAFEETLVEPNMLVVDLEKFIAPDPENWFSMDVKESVARVNVEVIEAADLKSADLNGLADPYVKGHLGQYRFRTQIQWKTLTPKWLEEFRVPICSWDSQNILQIEVRDKDRFVDDILGNCSVNISELRDEQRHDIWLPLENVKMGRLHLAITVVANAKEMEPTCEEEENEEEKTNTEECEMVKPRRFSSTKSNRSEKIADTYEPIDVDGQKETGIWVHHPGSEISHEWEARKGKSRHINSAIPSVDSPKSSLNSSSEDESKEGGHRAKVGNMIHKGFQKIFNKQPEKEDHTMNNFGQKFPSSPHANLKPVCVKRVGVNYGVVDANSEQQPILTTSAKEGCSDNEGSGAENSGKNDMKGRAKGMLKNVGKSASRLKQKVSRKGSSKFKQAGSLDVGDSPSPSAYGHSVGGLSSTASNEPVHEVLNNSQREFNEDDNCMEGSDAPKTVTTPGSEENASGPGPIESSLTPDSQKERLEGT